MCSIQNHSFTRHTAIYQLLDSSDTSSASSDAGMLSFNQRSMKILLESNSISDAHGRQRRLLIVLFFQLVFLFVRRVFLKMSVSMVLRPISQKYYVGGRQKLASYPCICEIEPGSSVRRANTSTTWLPEGKPRHLPHFLVGMVRSFFRKYLVTSLFDICFKIIRIR